MRHDDNLRYDEYVRDVVLDSEMVSYIDYQLNEDQQRFVGADGNTDIWRRILWGEYITKHLLSIEDEWMRLRRRSNCIVIYGAGRNCIRILDFITHRGIEIDGIAVKSQVDNPKSINGILVRGYYEFPRNTTMLISVLNAEEGQRIEMNLKDQGYYDVSYVNENMELYR